MDYWHVFEWMLAKIGLEPYVIILNDVNKKDTPLIGLNADSDLKCAMQFLNYSDAFDDGKYKNCKLLIAFRAKRKDGGR